MSDHRRRPRKNTPHKVNIVDQSTDQPIGRVVNITADGAMVVAKESMETGLKLKLRLVLPVMIQNQTEITVDAEVMWSRKDSNPAFFKTGIKFINLSGDDGFLIEDVMHKFNLVG